LAAFQILSKIREDIRRNSRESVQAESFPIFCTCIIWVHITLILLSLMTTSVFDTSSKSTPVTCAVVHRWGNLPPVPCTLVGQFTASAMDPVGQFTAGAMCTGEAIYASAICTSVQFTAGAVETGDNLPPATLIPLANLQLNFDLNLITSENQQIKTPLVLSSYTKINRKFSQDPCLNPNPSQRIPVPIWTIHCG
jgi:hypothetical protein